MMDEEKDLLEAEVNEDDSKHDEPIVECTEGEDISSGEDGKIMAEDSIEEKLEQAQEQYVRLFAEFDNFRKRTAKEKRETASESTARCIEQLLPIVDNFERAMNTPCSDENYHNGMVMILQQFHGFLEKIGVKEIEALGSEFNPNIHQAIKQANSEDYPENTVCEVFQKGYTLGERLIRPAMVAVSC